MLWQAIARGLFIAAPIAAVAGAGILLTFDRPVAASQTPSKPAPAAEGQPAKPAVQLNPAGARKDVLVEMRVIHARKVKNARTAQNLIDPRVRSIQRKLKRLFDFDSYRLVREEKVTLPFGVETPVKMPFRLFVRMKQNGVEDGKIKLSVRVGQKQAVALKLANGGTFLQGLTLKNNQSFILAISARTKN